MQPDCCFSFAPHLKVILCWSPLHTCRSATLPTCPQVTAAQLASMREREQRDMAQQAAEQQAAQRRMVSEDQYAAAVAVENCNR